MLNRLIGLTIAIVLSSLSLAQSTTDPPPSVEFAPWSEVTAPEGMREYHATFPSAVSSTYPENNVVPLTAFLPEDTSGPVPVVLVLHYLGATDLRVERALAGELVSRGLGAVLIALPYHADRTPAGKRSGQLAVSSDPDELVLTVRQSISDVRRTLDFIATRPEFDSTRIGIAGTSLGSVIATLALAIDPRLEKAALMLAGADIAHVLWHSSLLIHQREEFRKKGFTEAKLREALQSVEPLEYLKSRDDLDVYIIGARFDTVVPPADTQKLIDALPRAKTLWLQTGHYGGIFVQKRVQRTVSDFFSARFSNRDFTAPKNLYAPTLRLGVIASSESGFQLGAGIDLLRFDRGGNFLSTLYATPRGLQLFIGARVDKNLFIGGFGSQRGVGIGATWSTVL